MDSRGGRRKCLLAHRQHHHNSLSLGGGADRAPACATPFSHPPRVLPPAEREREKTRRVLVGARVRALELSLLLLLLCGGGIWLLAGCRPTTTTTIDLECRLDAIVYRVLLLDIMDAVGTQTSNRAVMASTIACCGRRSACLSSICSTNARIRRRGSRYYLACRRIWRQGQQIVCTGTADGRCSQSTDMFENSRRCRHATTNVPSESCARIRTTTSTTRRRSDDCRLRIGPHSTNRRTYVRTISMLQDVALARIAGRCGTTPIRCAAMVPIQTNDHRRHHCVMLQPLSLCALDQA